MADEKKQAGWESESSPDDYRSYSSPGLGAVTSGPEGTGAGAADYGGGRGTDYSEAPARDRDGGAREGETAPEFPPVGWGDRGENYASTRNAAERVQEPEERE